MSLLSLSVLLTSFPFVSSASWESIDVMATKSGLVNSLYLESIFPFKNVLGPGLELALTHCQESLKWNRWNCPSSDFLVKRSSKYLDRESAYVTTLTTAALIYTLTKNCSSGKISGCGCAESVSNEFTVCSDNSDYAEQVIGMIVNSDQTDGSDVHSYALLHNNRAAKNVIRRSLRRYCRCDGDTIPCQESKCWTALRPFMEIANEVRQMYDKARIVKALNSGKVDWEHLPEDVLVYVQDSPNYCNAGAVPGWNGMRGRQCSREKGKHLSQQERHSCKTLCRACGLRVRGQTVVGQKRCNCTFSWCCEVKCDVCVSVEKQYYCD